MERRHRTSLDALLLAYQQVECILHGTGTADCILDRIQRQAAILDGNRGRFGDDVPLDYSRSKRWKLLAAVGQPQQLVGATSVTALVFFLANRQHSELPEADGLRVGEAEYGDAFELAGQTPGALRERTVRDDEDQNPRRLQPSVTVVEKDELQSLVAVISDLQVVRWVEIEERAIACRKVGFEGATLRGWDAARSRSGCSICIKFDGRSLSREVFRDFEQRSSVASARINGEE